MLTQTLQMSWVAGANQETHRVIRATAPEGELFDMTVILLLQREQSWVSDS